MERDLRISRSPFALGDAIIKIDTENVCTP